MKIKLSKGEADGKIKAFFERGSFNAEEVKKIKRLAMKFNIKLGEHRKKFCKKCLSQLRGKLRINKGFKMIMCASCGFRNRWKLK